VGGGMVGEGSVEGRVEGARSVTILDLGDGTMRSSRGVTDVRGLEDVGASCEHVWLSENGLADEVTIVHMRTSRKGHVQWIG
jgi:hypothetical protein